MLRYHQQFVETIESYYNKKPIYYLYKFEDYNDRKHYLGSYYINIGNITVTDDCITEELKNVWLYYKVIYKKEGMVIQYVSFLKGFYTREQYESRYNHSHVEYSGYTTFKTICLGSSNVINTVGQYVFYKKHNYNLKELIEDVFVNIDNILMHEDDSNPFNRLINVFKRIERQDPIIIHPVLETASLLKTAVVKEENLITSIKYLEGDIKIFVDNNKLKEYCPEKYLAIINNDSGRTTFYQDYLDSLEEKGEENSSWYIPDEGITDLENNEFSNLHDPDLSLKEKSTNGFRTFKTRVAKYYDNSKEDSITYNKNAFIPHPDWTNLFKQNCKTLISYYYATEKTNDPNCFSENNSEASSESNTILSDSVLS